MRRLFFLGLYGLFWIAAFALFRILFLGIHAHDASPGAFTDWFLSFVHGFRLDLSVTSYILLGASILLLVAAPLKTSITKLSLLYYHFFLSFLSATIVIMDLELYRYWGFRLDITPLLYLKTPGEAAASVSIGECCILLLAILMLGLILYWSFKRLIYPKLNTTGSSLRSIPVLILAGAVLLIPARGGIGTVPINLSSAYYHQDQFLNHAAVNVLWNAVFSITESQKLRHEYELIPEDQAESIFRAHHGHHGSTEKVLQCKNPNLILIILESFSNKVMGSLGGEEGITPCLDSLAEDGILFENFYASGDRSDKGIVSIFSGFPAQPKTSIMNYPQKTQNLSFLYQPFKERGYHTSWYYGGNIEFANFKSYLNNAWTDQLVSLENFEEGTRDSKWGVHDEVLFKRVLDDLEKDERPFFLTLFTLSSHEPFKVPMKPKFGTANRDAKSRNAFYYTDSCLGAFINQLKQRSWWKDTWVIITADHGSRSPGNSPNYAVEKFQIPMLWLGGALAPGSRIIEKTCSQIDLPATILGQLGIKHTEYPYSKDILSDSPECFAYYAFNNGFGLVTDSTCLVYDLSANKRIAGRLTGNELSLGHALVQKIYDDYNRYGGEQSE